MLDDAVEEKDGGEKVRLGMVVCQYSAALRLTGRLIWDVGHSRQLGRHARSAGKNRRRTRGQRIERQITIGLVGGPKIIRVHYGVSEKIPRKAIDNFL